MGGNRWNRICKVMKSMDYEICTIDLKVPGWNSNKWNETWNEI